MPYDASGRGITQEEAYRREKWAAKQKRMGAIASMTAIVLLAAVLVAGLVGIGAFLFDMWESGEMWKQALALIGSGGFVAAVVVCALFTRFEV